MLHIAQLEEIQNLLLQVPELIHGLERRDPNFSSAVKQWLARAEHELVSNRLAVASEIAGLRGTLICAERGLIPEGITFTGHPTLRTIKAASTAQLLRKASERISSAIQVRAAQIVEGENLIQQIVSRARRKGLIPSELSASGNHVELLKGIWSALVSDPDVGAAAIHLAGLVGEYDALILLDRMALVPDSRRG
ncbi:MAG: hypothetical protein HY033_05515 [Ignavibacteriae bacterium]|nr:hypothetical protein [Ignavibacteria bacterium]MBI3364347.1 hypothetical protein [Ignavibacteriota bacterium]